jgi:hypothetical protein
LEEKPQWCAVRETKIKLTGQLDRVVTESN